LSISSWVSSYSPPSSNILFEYSIEPPNWCFFNKKRAQDAIFDASVKLAREKLKPWVQLPIFEDLEVHDIKIINWLNANMHRNRLPRSPQLYIWGPPDLGKTRLWDTISKYYRIYLIDSEEKYDCDWNDGLYDFAVIDEYSGEIPIRKFNKFLDGQQMSMLRKNGSRYVKKFNIPVIITSNHNPIDVYENVKNLRQVSLDAFRSRLEVVEIPTGKPIQCWELINELNK